MAQLLTNDSEILYKYVFIPFTIYMLGYWIPSLFFACIDIYLEYKGTIHKHKLQHKGPNWDLYPRTIIVALFNQFIITLPLIYFLKDFHHQYDLCTKDIQMTWISWSFRILMLNFATDIIFYWMHYLMHCSIIYKYIHSIHHAWKAPVAAGTVYAHPVEHFMTNIVPYYLPFYYLNLSWTCMLFWTAIIPIATTFAHSGYLIIYANDGRHDLHHHKFNVNYGLLFSDYIFGTYAIQYYTRDNENNLIEVENILNPELNINIKLDIDLNNQESDPELENKFLKNVIIPRNLKQILEDLDKELEEDLKEQNTNKKDVKEEDLVEIFQFRMKTTGKECSPTNKNDDFKNKLD
jgi:methylsterol monooxygenase